MMPNRNGHHPHSSEPKVIALAAAQTQLSEALLWQAAFALLASCWLSLLLH